MKKIFYLRRITLTVAVVLIAANSCKKKSIYDDPKESPREQNEAQVKNNTSENDTEFLAQAAQINIMEIEIGKLVKQKSVNQEIKDFGQLLIDDHNKSLNELKTLAEKNTITLPRTLTDEYREQTNKLKEKAGSEFDKEFINMIVDGHEKAVDKMTEISQKLVNEDFKLWSSRQIAIYLNHFEEAKKLKEKMNY